MATGSSILPTQVNDYECKLELYRHSVRGTVADYQIVLPPNETSIESIRLKTEDLFEAICLFYITNRWKARLVALCEYERMNNEGEVIGREEYHHASYQAEWCSILTADEFYRNHLEKINNRIETFLSNGSSLRLVAFKHLHIAVTVAVSSN